MKANFYLQRGLYLFMLLGVMGGAYAVAQDSAASVPSYDAVSIKPNKAGDNRMMIRHGQTDYAGTNITLKQLLRYAYDLTTDDQISGLPGWAESDHWDIVAKMDAETVAAQKKMPEEESNLQRRAMMQKMLADRFKLTTHHEQKEWTVYNLVIAKGGSKLTEIAPEAPAGDGPLPKDGKMHGGMSWMETGKLTAQGVPVASLGSFLAQTLHKQVIDKTGLTGKYDMTLQWTPDDMPTGSHEATGVDTNAPSIYTALQEQLGLRLDTVKGPVDTIVVDHVEVASEN